MDFNSTIFAAMVAEFGGSPKVYPITKDCLEEIQRRVEQAAQACDIVLLNAGSSAGREDYSCQAIENIGKVVCHGIAIKPGKPAILGLKGAVPILGVPGYPVSGILILREILQPLMEHLTGHSQVQKDRVEAVLSRSVLSGLKYQEFIRVRMGNVGGRLMASPLNRGKRCGDVLCEGGWDLGGASGNREGYEAGQTVEVQLLRPMEELQRTLVAIGSHDPLLDELADLFRQDGACFLSSSHVGSMGGIMAVRRGEAHMAGVHLLDERDGSLQFVLHQKILPSGRRSSCGVRGTYAGADDSGGQSQRH